VLLVLLLSTWIAYSQAAAPATQPNSRKTSTPYTGDLARFDSPGREERLQLPRVMEILGINGGKNVADIGAGSGWFTVRAAKRVGDAGIVYAVDINPEAVRHIEDRIKKEHVKNVRAILSKPEDPMLPAESVDAVLMLKTYHEVADPVTLLRKLRPALRADARVGIIERNGNGEDHGINRDVVIREAKEAGYVVAQEMDWKHDEMDYFLVLRMQ
jgi:cyclopropane fatty-acyl-phospholipid synthase-like methyltransferase